MAWIRKIPLEEAGGELAGLYRRISGPGGRLDHILQVHSLHPAGLAAHIQLYTAVMRPTPGLGKLEREMIAVAVSRANGCHY